MRAAVFRGAFDIRVEQIPDASILEPTDAIIRITHACICGTMLGQTYERSDEETASSRPMTSVMAPVNSVAKDWIALASKEVSGAMGTRVDRPRRFALASQTPRWWRFHRPWKEMKPSSKPSFR